MCVNIYMYVYMYVYIYNKEIEYFHKEKKDTQPGNMENAPTIHNKQ